MATQLSNQLSKNQNWKSSGKRNVMLPTLDPILSRYPRRIRNSEWWRKQSNRTGVRESTAETGDSCAGHIKSMLWTRCKAEGEHRRNMDIRESAAMPGFTKPCIGCLRGKHQRDRTASLHLSSVQSICCTIIQLLSALQELAR